MNKNIDSKKNIFIQKKINRYTDFIFSFVYILWSFE